ncbi:MAG: DEAD/DEAH box helicase, partial [Planctomycetota bacterium]
MTSTALADTAPAVSAARPEVREARDQVLSILRAARGKVPLDLLADHLFAVYADAGFPILRAAAEATARRLVIVGEERLRPTARPRSGPFGDYRTARTGRTQRPYTTRLMALAPLRASCACPDFRGNSLGLCKHVLALLADLAKLPRTFAHTRTLPTPPETLALRWNPIKPLVGDGDWLARVTMTGAMTTAPAALPGAWRLLRRHFTERSDTLVLRTTHRDAPQRRLALLDAMAAAIVGVWPDAADPALRACLADERERLVATIAMLPHQLDAKALRGFQRTLYPYQREGVARFLRTGRLLLADDMGLGKTTQAIAACHALVEFGLVRRGLLVVPASLKHQWLREWQACTGLPLQMVEGTPEERRRCYRTQRRGFLVTNYEQLLRDVDLVQKWAPEIVLLDEAQRMKNWETRTAATVKQLAPRFRLVLTGTPFENRVLELDSLLEWLDRRPLQPQWRLLPFHQLAGGEGLQHLDVLRARLAPVVLRRRRQEVLDQLPGRTDTSIDVALTPAQREAHDELQQPIAQLLATAERRPLTQPEFLRLMAMFTEQRILANGIAQHDFDDVWPGVRGARPEPALLEGLSMPKLGELRLLLQQLAIDQGRKVVVFSQWQKSLQLAAWAAGEPLARAGVRCAFFTGAQTLRQRNDNIVAFHDDPALRVLFATDAGGIGLNLQKAASCCVHFDLPWNPAVFEQRVGRIWRLGQSRKIDVYSLVSQDCIESRIAGVLVNKQATFTAVFDGTSDEVRFDQKGGFLAAARRLAAGAAAAGAGATGTTGKTGTVAKATRAQRRAATLAAESAESSEADRVPENRVTPATMPDPNAARRSETAAAARSGSEPLPELPPPALDARTVRD